MSNFPNFLDTDIELPRVENNISEIGDVAINALRDATFNIEAEIGIGASGTASSIANRLNVALDPAGNIKPAALSLLPQLNNIVNSQISPTAGIKESKLQLDYSTASLYNYISNFNISLNTALNFIINTGSKFEQHLQGITYRHDLTHIDVSPTNTGYLKNQYGAFRNNTNLYTLINDINSDYISHQKTNGTDTPVPPTGNFAHNASGIEIKSANFASIPQTTNNLQKFADYLDGAGILTIGSRIQTLYGNGISRASRSLSLNTIVSTNNALSNIRLGQPVVPITTITTYLSNFGNIPIDNIDTGDDVIEFTPTVGELANNLFDSKFANIRVGDIISVNYNTVIVSFIIKEYKYVSGVNRRFLVRINGKNLLSGTAFTARIDRALFNTNKYGALALAPVPSPINGVLPSLIVATPRGAQVLGIGFNATFLDSTHYNLYLSLYPTGNPSDSIVNMAPIDVTGNSGTTPGKYTLDSIVNTINTTFRSTGFNYRFIAFSYQGNLGVMLADSIGNASFSITSGVLGVNGLFNQGLSNTTYPNNVIDVFNHIDPLGFGIAGSNVASPPYTTIFNPIIAALNPTKLIVPLSKNNYYVDGAEKENLKYDINQLLDANKDGYWLATISKRLVIAGSRIQTTYTITGFDLSSSGLKVGKTITVQQNVGGTAVDFGRFIIQNIEFKTCDVDVPSIDITVYDAIHSTGVSPSISSGVGTNVRLYFSSDSVGFNIENVSDINASVNYKRSFEVYIDSQSYTFTHERARLLANGITSVVNGVALYSSTELANINIYNVSPKLRGYVFSNVRKINLQVNSYDTDTGIFEGYLCRYDGYVSNAGPTTVGKKGEIVRFFDETNVDYIDFIFDIDASIAQISTPKNIDIQLFPTLSLDDEVMLLGTCQVNDITRELKYLRDSRQFGNTSEKQLTNSAIDFINAGNRLLHQNGVVNGFDIISTSAVQNSIIIRGGSALVNGNLIEINNTQLSVPLVQEVYLNTDYSKINWALCVNAKGEYKLVALTDYDSIAPATPNASNRIINVKNINNVSTYTIESRSFIEIIEKRKDLTILYIITSIVDSSGVLTALTVNDSRKYVFENNSFIDPVLTSIGSQGNFYNFDSLATWLKFNSKNNNNIGIKDNCSVDKTYDFSGNYVVKFNGNNVSTITFNAGSNVIFENFHFNEVPLIINSGATVIFINCVFDPTSLTVNSGGTATLTNCVFDTTSVVFNSGSNITLNNNTFKNGSINLNQPITLNAETVFNNMSFTVSSANGFILNSNDIGFDNCIFNYTFDPTSPADGYYITGNIVNSSSGLIYVKNTSSFQRKNLFIKGCSFTNTTSDHYPFISFEFNHIDSQYQDILIENNRFYSSTLIDDIRSAIVFKNNVITGLTTLEGPRLVNTFIKNNLFDKNQVIAIYTVKDGSNNINNALSTINCIIKGNICGSILYTTRYETARNYANTNGFVKDKESSLIIENNNCKSIGNGFASGNLLVESGKVILNSNTLSTVIIDIKFGSTKEERRNSLSITQNMFYGNSTSYAVIIQGHSATDNLFNVNISNNSFNFGTTVASDGTTKTIGYYTSGIIYANISTVIKDNILKGAGNSSNTQLNNSIVYVAGGSIITGNYFYRGSLSLGSGAYISLYQGASIITDNYFDFPTVDGTSETLLDLQSTATAVYERNKNQTGYYLLSVLNGEKQWDSSSYTDINVSTNAVLGNLDTAHAYTFFAQGTLQDTNQHFYRRIFDITGKLPKSVNLLEIKQGIFFRLSGSTFDHSASANLFETNISSSITDMNAILDAANQVNPSELLGTQGLDTNVLTSKSILNGGDDSLITTSTYYLITDLSSLTNNYNTRDNRSINLSVSYSMKLTTGAFAEFYFSPVRIKYRW